MALLGGFFLPVVGLGVSLNFLVSLRDLLVGDDNSFFNGPLPNEFVGGAVLLPFLAKFESSLVLAFLLHLGAHISPSSMSGDPVI